MRSHSQKNTSRNTDSICTKPSCFFCTMNKPDTSCRKPNIIKAFRDMPFQNDQEHVLALNTLWNIAMNRPNDPEFPSLGIFECMAKLIIKGINDKEWLLTHQNICIPYYAAHIIGSYTMNKVEFAEKAVESGVLSPLMELMRGKITWLEQRVAVRALAHIFNHDKIFEEVIGLVEVEVVELAMQVALTCLKEVFHKFVGLKHSERLRYQRNLVTRGYGGLEIEDKKAEEWASELQWWSLNLLNFFVCREKSLNLICKKKFLVELCGMWGGLANKSSAGIRLLRSLCQTKIGRQSVANLQEVVESLCNLSRSSDDWQLMAIDCLLLLLKDPDTRYKVIEISVVVFVDLVELRSCGGRPKLGDSITQVVLQDYHMIKYGTFRFRSQKVERALEEIWDLKVDRKRREKLMPEEEIKETKTMVKQLKIQGNLNFWSGNIEKAVMEYSEALKLCPITKRTERLVLYSNRAQCHLLLRNPEAAISDSTRALCLSGARTHGKSLWRRSVAYDKIGLPRESLMDCLMFVNGSLKSERRKSEKILCYAARMISKQMNRTWLFAAAAGGKSRTFNKHEECLLQSHGHSGEPSIVKETFAEKSLRKKERARRSKKGVDLTNRVGRLKIG